ncbi:MAG TPA: hypothetical protein VLE53_06520 [Gemmatimonadaceae bacterium]|nr:hypothetical protein [Gemmatimonadaceae bacterium]
MSVSNSGLEVWLYDDANRLTIRNAGPPESGFGGMPPNFEELSRQGLIVGYSLYQDDEVDVAVHVGAPFTDEELSAGRWLEPQPAYLRLPSGRLCIESNDASRVGPEEPGETGAVVDVPPGDYRLTLYRVDHEALSRGRLTWRGPQEMILLTPGGTPDDAAGELLPFQERRDLTWVGKYTIDGQRAEALAWFDDYWDTFKLNLDSAAASKLSLTSGRYLRTHIPQLGLTMITAYAASWEDAKRLPPPGGVTLEEYGYGSIIRIGDWNGAEALLCKRDSSKTRVEDEHHTTWIPAVVEVLDDKAHAPVTVRRGFTATELASKGYFDSGFLGLVLMDVLPGVDELDELPLPQALDRLDRTLGKLGFTPQGDVAWQEQVRAETVEATCRFYGGVAEAFAVILAAEGSFEVFFLTELDDATWVMTGLADEITRRIERTDHRGLPVPNPRVHLRNMDESLVKIWSAHKAALKEAERASIAAPSDLAGAVEAFERFVGVAFA